MPPGQRYRGGVDHLPDRPAGTESDGACLGSNPAGTEFDPAVPTAADLEADGHAPESDPSSPESSDPPAQLRFYPDGPLLVRGDFEMIGRDGNPLPRTRATVALCRCGLSSIKPYCDGSHKLSRFSDVRPADAAAVTSSEPTSG